MKKNTELFNAYPANIKKKLLELRALIFQVAQDEKAIGLLEETLRWGQPSYITSVTKSGSTIRIDQYKKSLDHYAIYFHCQTSLVENFRFMFGDLLEYEGNRALIFNVKKPIPKKIVSQCIKIALTYHLQDLDF
jgi:hypothetical protein